MTPAAAFALIAAHRIRLGPHGLGWCARCLIRDGSVRVLDYYEAFADSPLAAVETLAIERGWIAEAQQDLFEMVPERKEA